MNPKLVMALGVLVSAGSACSSSPSERPMSGFGETTAGSGGSSSGSAGDDKGSVNPLPTFGTGGTFATGTGTATGGGGGGDKETRRRGRHRARRHVSRFQREASRLRTPVRGGRGAPQTGRRDARYRPKAGIFELDGVPFQSGKPSRMRQLGNTQAGDHER